MEEPSGAVHSRHEDERRPPADDPHVERAGDAGAGGTGAGSTGAGRARRAGRAAWAATSLFVVESAVLGIAALPAVAFWQWHLTWSVAPAPLRIVVLAMSLVPAYVIFAATLMAASALAARLLRWRTPADAALRLSALEWPLLDWVRYVVLTHVVRVLAGTVFRASPLWSWYLRLNGARIGRGVFVNSLGLFDHNLLTLDDGVVVGSDVHLSGHTVEGGMLRTAPVHLGAGVTVGVGSVVSVGVRAGAGCQIGALSYVPKFARLAAAARYGGVPVRRLADGRPSGGAPPKPHAIRVPLNP